MRRVLLVATSGLGNQSSVLLKAAKKARVAAKAADLHTNPAYARAQHAQVALDSVGAAIRACEELLAAVQAARDAFSAAVTAYASASVAINAARVQAVAWPVVTGTGTGTLQPTAVDALNQLKAASSMIEQHILAASGDCSAMQQAALAARVAAVRAPISWAVDARTILAKPHADDSAASWLTFAQDVLGLKLDVEDKPIERSMDLQVRKAVVAWYLLYDVYPNNINTVSLAVLKTQLKVRLPRPEDLQHWMVKHMEDKPLPEPQDVQAHRAVLLEVLHDAYRLEHLLQPRFFTSKRFLDKQGLPQRWEYFRDIGLFVLCILHAEMRIGEKLMNVLLGELRLREDLSPAEKLQRWKRVQLALNRILQAGTGLAAQTQEGGTQESNFQEEGGTYQEEGGISQEDEPMLDEQDQYFAHYYGKGASALPEGLKPDCTTEEYVHLSEMHVKSKSFKMNLMAQRRLWSRFDILLETIYREGDPPEQLQRRDLFSNIASAYGEIFVTLNQKADMTQAEVYALQLDQWGRNFVAAFGRKAITNYNVGMEALIKVLRSYSANGTQHGGHCGNQRSDAKPSVRASLPGEDVKSDGERRFYDGDREYFADGLTGAAKLTVAHVVAEDQNSGHLLVWYGDSDHQDVTPEEAFNRNKDLAKRGIVLCAPDAEPGVDMWANVRAHLASMKPVPGQDMQQTIDVNCVVDDDEMSAVSAHRGLKRGRGSSFYTSDDKEDDTGSRVASEDFEDEPFESEEHFESAPHSESGRDWAGRTGHQAVSAAKLSKITARRSYLHTSNHRGASSASSTPGASELSNPSSLSHSSTGSGSPSHSSGGFRASRKNPGPTKPKSTLLSKADREAYDLKLHTTIVATLNSQYEDNGLCADWIAEEAGLTKGRWTNIKKKVANHCLDAKDRVGILYFWPVVAEMYCKSSSEQRKAVELGIKHAVQERKFWKFSEGGEL
ncbi:hypothetical protein B484DRAFT_395338 [Ochromonadaceae sp. CCMP2298]|nr:hypothetical protein B484DRAFT_395347 [Ochromonadaceae sp. CCMP2298]KAJ1431684.1 hypothetical protein B484DRAFT_395338 [Ochromonadaceae sp. CCMP2298]